MSEQDDEKTEPTVDVAAIRRTARRIADWLTVRAGVSRDAAIEALFLAGIAPDARGKNLPKRVAARLASAVARVQELAHARLHDASACPDCRTPLQLAEGSLDWCRYCPRCQPERQIVERPRPKRPKPGRFRIGCALWSYAPWSGVLYPDRTPAPKRLGLYGHRFTCVEGNSFFYAQPAPETLERWVEDTPEDFRFYPKFPRHVSHEGDLARRAGAAIEFLDALAPLGPRLGPVFLQLPPAFGPRSLDDLRRFLEDVAPQARTRDLELGVEVRTDALVTGPKADALDQLLSRLDVARVMLDTRAVFQEGPDPQKDAPRPKPRLMCEPRLTSRHAILRFVAHPDLPRNEDLLAAWADRLGAWLRDGVAVTFFAHCPDEVFSPLVARRIQVLLEERQAPVLALPWNTLPPEKTQKSLF